MREIFHGQLEQLGADLALMCGLVSEAMVRASRGLLTADLALVESVITDGEHRTEFAAMCEEHACSLLALQAPVARDLRVVVTAIKAAEKPNAWGPWHATSPRSPACVTQIRRSLLSSLISSVRWRAVAWPPATTLSGLSPPPAGRTGLRWCAPMTASTNYSERCWRL